MSKKYILHSFDIDYETNLILHHQTIHYKSKFDKSQFSPEYLLKRLKPEYISRFGNNDNFELYYPYYIIFQNGNTECYKYMIKVQNAQKFITNKINTIDSWQYEINVENFLDE